MYYDQVITLESQRTRNIQKSCISEFNTTHPVTVVQMEDWSCLIPSFMGGEKATVIQPTIVSLQLLRALMTHSGHRHHIIQCRCLLIATTARHIHKGVRERRVMKDRLNVQETEKSASYFANKPSSGDWNKNSMLEKVQVQMPMNYPMYPKAQRTSCGTNSMTQGQPLLPVSLGHNEQKWLRSTCFASESQFYTGISSAEDSEW